MQQLCNKEMVEKWGAILCNATWYTWAKGGYSEVEQISLKAKKALLKVYGKENIEVLSYIEMLGILYRCRGQ